MVSKKKARKARFATVAVLVFLKSSLSFAGYKGEFFMAGISYGVAIYLSVLAHDSKTEHYENREMYRISDKKSKEFAEMSGMWDHLARNEFAENGDTNLYRHYRNEVLTDTFNSEKFKKASLNFARQRDSSDEESNKWTVGSYTAAGVGTVMLIKGIVSYMRREKKNHPHIEIQSYPDSLGLKLAYAF